MIYLDLSRPNSTLTRHQRGLILTLYHYWRGAASVRYRTRAEITVLCVKRRFSCRRKSYLVQFEHCLNVGHLQSFSANFLFFPLFSSFTSVNQTGSNKERKIKKEMLLQEMVRNMFYIYPLVFQRRETCMFAAEQAVNRNPFETDHDLFFFFSFVSPHVKESNKVLDAGFHDVVSSRIPGTRDFSHFQWILYCGFQSLEGFRISSAACGIPNSASPISRIS